MPTTIPITPDTDPTVTVTRTGPTGQRVAATVRFPDGTTVVADGDTASGHDLADMFHRLGYRLRYQLDRVLNPDGGLTDTTADNDARGSAA